MRHPFLRVLRRQRPAPRADLNDLRARPIPRTAGMLGGDHESREGHSTIDVAEICLSLVDYAEPSGSESRSVDCEPRSVRAAYLLGDQQRLVLNWLSAAGFAAVDLSPPMRRRFSRLTRVVLQGGPIDRH